MNSKVMPASTTDERGAFVRQNSQFRNWITETGSAGITGEPGFKAEIGRYHLYVSLNCPWAHRTLIFHKLKQLEGIVSVSVLNPQRTSKGWTFSGFPGTEKDPVMNADFLSELYHLADPDYSGRYTVPLLWDKRKNTIVSNESADIIRMFNSAFDAFTVDTSDFYPSEFRQEIDELNKVIYEKLNNGVYRAGFAQSQDAYEEAYHNVFDCLDNMDFILSTRKFLLGDRVTEVDWRLFVTLIRFDLVYYSLFKCNKRRVCDYSNLVRYMKDLYSIEGVADTINFDHIKAGYWRKSERNPTGIIPLGPDLDEMFFLYF